MENINNGKVVASTSRASLRNDKERFLDNLKIPSAGLTLAQHATEHSEAEKFDDVVFQYQRRKDDSWKFRLLQAKHRERATRYEELPKITEAQLLSTDDGEDFSLQKYFQSYLKIQQRSNESSIYSVFSKEREIEDIIVITSTDFNSEKFKQNLEEVDIEKDELLEVYKTRNKQWEKTMIYKIPETNAIVRKLEPIFKNSSDFYKLVEELADHIHVDSRIDKTGLFKDYYYPLMGQVFKNEVIKVSDKDEKSKKYCVEFRPEFISGDGLSDETSEFRDALMKEISFIKSNQKKFKMSEDFGKEELPGDDAQLKDLAKKLVSCYEKKQKLTLSNFGDYHICMATEVINPKTKKFWADFINPKKNKSNINDKKKLRNELLAEIKETRNKKTTLDDLKSMKFELSEDFGKGKLPNDNDQLKQLAKVLADAIKNEKELNPSLSKEYHVVLTQEVIHKDAKRFHQTFVCRKSKDGTGMKQLSTTSKHFRRFFLDQIVSAEQIENTVDSLKVKQIKVSDGFVKAFKPANDPEIENLREFTRLIHDLLIKSFDEKIVEINDDSVKLEKLNTFKTNIQKLAGYVLIKKFKKVRFSTSFLLSDKPPGNFNKFREKLKKALADKFESIYEFEFRIDFKASQFQTCEEGVLDRKLPILYKDTDVANFFSKLKFVVNFPNRKNVNDLIEGEINEKLKTLDSKAFNSLYESRLHNWMSNRIGTYYTVDKARKLFQEIKHLFLFWKMNGVTVSHFANVSKEYQFREHEAIVNFLRNKQQVLHLVFENLYLGRTRTVQTFEKITETVSNDIKQYTQEFGHAFLYSEQLLKDDLHKDVLEYFEDKKLGNLIILECDTQQEIAGLFDNLSKVITSNGNKKLVLITQINDYLGNKFQANASRLKYEAEYDATNFHDLVEDSQNKLFYREVTLQGKQVPLNKFMGVDNFSCLSDDRIKKLSKIIDSSTLVRFISNEKIEIGNMLSRLSHAEAAYAKLYESVEISNFIENISKDLNETDQTILPLFIVSGNDHLSSGTMENKLVNQLKLAIDTTNKQEKIKIDYIQNLIGTFRKDNVSDKRILVTSDRFMEGDFKQLCRDYPDKIIYWINWENGKLVCQEIYNPNFYFDRKFLYPSKVVITEDLRTKLVEGTPTSKFIFTGIQNYKELINFLCIEKWKSDEQNIILANIVLKNSEGEAKDEFQNLSKGDKSVHWLTAERIDGNLQFIWNCSHGSLNELSCYIDESKCEHLLLNESEFAEKLKDKEKILIDEPGMGKSTTLTKLSERKINSNWVIRINLKDCQDAIKNLVLDSKVIKIETAVKFLLQVGNFDPDTDLTIVEGLLQYKLENASGSWPLLILFDGFDEIKSDSEDNKGKIGILLQFLKDKSTVWVTARNHETEALQNSLSIFETTFEEFTREMRKEFLKKFWMIRMSLTLSQNKLAEVFGLKSKTGRRKDNPNKKICKFERYSEALLVRMDKVLNEKHARLMGIPLQLRLLAEGFEDKFKAFIKAEDDDTSDFSTLDVLGVFQHFVDAKYNIFYKEKTGLSRGFSEVSQEWFTELLTKRHCRLAFKELFDNDVKAFIGIKSPFVEGENESEIKVDVRQLEELRRVGLIQSFRGNHFEFIHRTFAEYFVASLLVNMLSKKEASSVKYQCARKFLLKHIFRQSNWVIRNFLEHRIKQKSSLSVEWNAINDCDFLKKSKYYRKLKYTPVIKSEDSLNNIKKAVEANINWKRSSFFYNDRDIILIPKLFKKFLEETNIDELENTLKFLVEINGKSLYDKVNNAVSEEIGCAVYHYLTQAKKQNRCHLKFIEKILNLIKDDDDITIEKRIEDDRLRLHLGIKLYSPGFSTSELAELKNGINSIYQNHADLQWLERKGIIFAKSLLLLTPEMSNTFNLILDEASGGWRSIYMDKVINRLILPFLELMLNGECNINQSALLDMFQSFEENISLNSKQLRGLLKVIKNIFQSVSFSTEKLSSIIQSLIMLRNWNLKLIDMEEDLLILDPFGDFKCKLSLEHKDKVVQLIKLMQNEDSNFDQQCAELTDAIILKNRKQVIEGFDLALPSTSNCNP